MSELSNQLIVNVDNQLHTLGYATSTIAAYHRVWKCLSEFMNAKDIRKFNKETCEDFFAQVYGLTLNEPPGTYTPEARHCHRAIIVLLEFQNSGTIPGRRLSKDHTFNEAFQPAIGEFMAFVNASVARTSYRQIRS